MLTPVETASYDSLETLPRSPWKYWTIGGLGTLVVLAGIFFLRTELSISAEGVVRASRDVSFYAPQDGVLVERFGRVGDWVEEGAVLGRFAAREETRQILLVEREILLRERAIAALADRLAGIGQQPADFTVAEASARRELIEAIMAGRENLLERYAGLEELRAISSVVIRQEELSLLRNRLEALEADFLENLREGGFFAREREQLLRLRASLEAEKEIWRQEESLLREVLEERTIRAPMAGQLTAWTLRYPGQRVSAGEFFGRISDSREGYRFRGFVDERNVDLVQSGARVRMQSGVFDGPLDGYVYGVVDWIAPEAVPASVSGEMPRWELEITVTDSPYDLPLGSSLQAEIIIGQRSLWALFTRQTSNLRQTPP